MLARVKTISKSLAKRYTFCFFRADDFNTAVHIKNDFISVFINHPSVLFRGLSPQIFPGNRRQYLSIEDNLLVFFVREDQTSEKNATIVTIWQTQTIVA